MKSALELHDSECLAIESDSHGNGTVILDAYVHRTDGEPAVSPGDGGIQRVRFILEMMTTEGEIGSLPATIFEGSLVLDNSDHRNIVPLPLRTPGNATLTLMLADDARLIKVSGRSVSVEPEGEFRFVEHVDFSHRYPDE
jgi:hypothetical protein